MGSGTGPGNRSFEVLSPGIHLDRRRSNPTRCNSCRHLCGPRSGRADGRPYRLVGYETRALNREDFNNDKVDAGDVGSGHAVTAIYEITPVGSKARLIDESRYAEASAATARGKANEYGFLRIRYKLPNGSRSRLIEEPIRIDAGVPAALRDNVEFSTAVAGFGQLLRGGKYTGELKFDDVIRQARGALGEDPYGYRAEFLTLVHKAKETGGK